jgi:Fe-Mn family superoxide dismutase
VDVQNKLFKDFLYNNFWNLYKHSVFKIPKDFEKFKEEYTAKTIGVFGSGWSFLAKDKAGKLVITQEGAAGNPMKQGMKPILTCDVWEHAYYIDFRNLRPKYLEAFWALANWNFASKNFES